MTLIRKGTAKRLGLRHPLRVVVAPTHWITGISVAGVEEHFRSNPGWQVIKDAALRINWPEPVPPERVYIAPYRP